MLAVIRTPFNIPDKYVVSTNGVGNIKVKLPANLGSNAEWSPDSKWIISSTQYEVSRPEESAIYLMHSDGNQRRLIIHNKGGSFNPTWSPDGAHIAYYARDKQPGIYLLDIECMKQSSQNCALLPTFLTPGNSAPDWSSDGKRIAYQNGEEIFISNLDSTQPPLNLTPNMSYCHDPQWSPDATRLVFSCYQADSFDIFTIRPDGSDILNLTKGIGSNTKPVWSPDGNKIAFISNRDGLGKIIGMDDTIRSSGIFLMDSQGNNIVRLSLRGDEDVLWFAWLPANISEMEH